MVWKQCLKELLVAFVVVVVSTNVFFWVFVGVQFPGVTNTYEDGVVLAYGDTVFLFVHGGYRSDCPEWLHEAFKPLAISWDAKLRHCTIRHYTWFGDEKIPTLDYITEIRAQGYESVWGSWCGANRSYIEWTPRTGDYTLWPAYVSRNEYSSKTVPVFLGFGFIRLSV